MSLLSSNTLRSASRYTIYKGNRCLEDSVSIDQIDFILTKQFLREHQESLLTDSRSSKFMSTGGSSGDPLVFPVNQWNAREAKEFIIHGRERIGFGYGTKTALIWGHSHLLNSWHLRWMRRIKDYFQSYYRFSAYSLDRNSLDSIWRKIRSRDIKHIIGYSSALELLIDRGIELNINVEEFSFLFTAETIDFQKHERYYSLGCKLFYEYGSAEFGPIMYGSYVRGYHVINPRVNIEIIKSELIISDIDTKKEFPFIRYKTGDIVDVKDGVIFKIDGRKYGELLLNDKVISGEVLTHAIKSVCTGSFNVRVNNSEWIVSVDGASKEELQAMYARTAKLLKWDNVPIVFNNQYRRIITRAGKVIVFATK